MTPAEYAECIAETALYPGADSQVRGGNVKYCQLGLGGEIGELLGEVKKVARNDGGVLTEERRLKLIDEVGDCYWYFVRLALHVGRDLSNDFPKNKAAFATSVPSFADLTEQALWAYQMGAPLVIDPQIEDPEDIYAWFNLADALFIFLGYCNSTPEEAMQRNVEKLLGRKERGTLVGDGGTR